MLLDPLSPLHIKQTVTKTKAAPTIKYSTVIIPNQGNSFIKASPITAPTRVAINAVQRLDENQITKFNQEKFYQMINANKLPPKSGDACGETDN